MIFVAKKYVHLNFLTKQPTKRATIGFLSSSPETPLIEKSFARCPHKVTLMLSSLYEGLKNVVILEVNTNYDC
jgi:hypothetical protein